eukprot:TRINITY_DN1690_c0_g1_i1.p1 TRINITY_DN1690_c0_g1~~TRINITY_DN1690_c0_g1_i1.p1  ORF type:complete len:621 (-),score=84.67 TRINITY_DN1690_c0_g1_i1:293-2155(-)
MKGVTDTINSLIGGRGRNAVSRDKFRFQDGEVDLDLTYITERIIAMGLPGSGVDQLWRNDIDQVARFFDKYHRGHFCIYNLSGEEYDYSKFHNSVVDFGFPDHGTCPLEFLEKICKAMKKYLLEAPDNIIVVHCLAGRGRTGTIIAAFLIYAGMFDDGYKALEFFAKQRSSKSEGVITPSQIRYVDYFNSVMTQGHQLTNKPFVLNRIVMTPCPVIGEKGFKPVIIVYRLGTKENPEESLWSGNTDHAARYKRGTPDVTYKIEPHGCFVEGDVQLKFYHRAKTRMEHTSILNSGGFKKVEQAMSLSSFPLICLFRTTFHTSFLPVDQDGNAVLELRKNQLDGMFSGQAHIPALPDNFRLKIFFGPRPTPGALSKSKPMPPAQILYQEHTYAPGLELSNSGIPLGTSVRCHSASSSNPGSPVYPSGFSPFSMRHSAPAAGFVLAPAASSPVPSSPLTTGSQIFYSSGVMSGPASAPAPASSFIIAPQQQQPPQPYHSGSGIFQSPQAASSFIAPPSLSLSGSSHPTYSPAPYAGSDYYTYASTGSGSGSGSGSGILMMASAAPGYMAPHSGSHTTTTTNPYAPTTFPLPTDPILPPPAGGYQHPPQHPTYYTYSGPPPGSY